MKPGAVLLLAAVLSLTVIPGAISGPAESQSGTGGLEVFVSKLGVREGIPGVRLRLSPINNKAQNGASPLPRPQNSPPPQTDGAGQFYFRDLAAGDYTVSAELDGYVAPPLSGSVFGLNADVGRITVAAGQTARVNLTLTRSVDISGRVVDSNSKALVDASVSAYRLIYRPNGRVTLSAVSSAKTSATGEYRLTRLIPGPYYLAATPKRSTAMPGPASIPVTTFYPNVADERNTLPINITENAIVAGMDIRIQTRRAYSIFGRLVNNLPAQAKEASGASATFYLISRQPTLLNSTDPEPAKSALNRNSGQFEIAGVLPGSYELLAVVPITDSYGARTLFPAAMDVEVLDRDVNNVNMSVKVGGGVQARIAVDGVTVQDRMGLRMTSLESYSTPYTLAANGNTSQDRSGIFTFKNVPSGLYTFEILGLPENGYVADIRPGGVVREDGFQVPGDSGGVFEVSVLTDGVTLQGVARDVEQRPISGATVVLVPQEFRRRNLALYKKAQSDGQGGFRFTGVAPGDYKVFAWDRVMTDAWLNADFIRAYEHLGTGVTVASGVPLNLEVRIISSQNSGQ